ncbi:MAG: DUF1846 domain-containing protein [Clostridia bacterium]|nr:DUF1846 domain-containing protein [Clostridia bacterium]
MKKIGFDNDKYIALQSQKIEERIARFGGKLYLEFGGKLFDDHHASRVLPGFAPDSKIRMLTTLKDQAEIVIVVNSGDIEKNKVRGDLGITYDQDVLRLIDAFRGFGLLVGCVVLTKYEGQITADAFKRRLETLGMKVYCHYHIPGYPSDINGIVSEQGLGRNPYIETTRPLVVVTAPGPGSGKMATCLSQLYHDYRRGIASGYAKFETFPIWNLPLKHPVNVAYEAATADLDDVNMIDPFHLEVYHEATVNYNRDVEIFPVLRAMFEKIGQTAPYRSPTEMGVNMAGFCITDDQAVREAASQEIIRRYYAAKVNYRKGLIDQTEQNRIKLLMDVAGISVESRKVIEIACKKAEQTGVPAVAMELSDGRIVTGRNSNLLGAASAMILNALKMLAGIPDDIHLLSPDIIVPIQDLKTHHLGNHNPRLHTDEILIALAISAVDDPYAAHAMAQLKYLEGGEMHSSVILSQVDEGVLRKLGINFTTEPKYQTKKLFHG